MRIHLLAPGSYKPLCGDLSAYPAINSTNVPGVANCANCRVALRAQRVGPEPRYADAIRPGRTRPSDEHTMQSSFLRNTASAHRARRRRNAADTLGIMCLGITLLALAALLIYGCVQGAQFVLETL